MLIEEATEEAFYFLALAGWAMIVLGHEAPDGSFLVVIHILIFSAAFASQPIFSYYYAVR